MRVVAVLLALAGAGAATVAEAAGPERVDIMPGEGVLYAYLYRPSGPGPFPAVVALHSCSSLTERTGAIAPRYREWGERLAAAGFVVLFPDSYGSRGLRSQCRVQEGPVRVRRERIADAYAARRWLQSKSWVVPDRISLLGWANGAMTALWSVRPRAQARDGKPDFRSAVAFYPSCRRLRDQAWSGRIPALILIGTADDWTPASVCQQMVAGARGRSAGATLVTYPGAHHDFDRPNLVVHVRTGLAFTPDGSGRAHVGTDPAAREDALKRVPEWLTR
jgi:dienelactone hydrolase